jgi:hypothetical protein
MKKMVCDPPETSKPNHPTTQCHILSDLNLQNVCFFFLSFCGKVSSRPIGDSRAVKFLS